MWPLPVPADIEAHHVITHLEPALVPEQSINYSSAAAASSSFTLLALSTTGYRGGLDHKEAKVMAETWISSGAMTTEQSLTLLESYMDVLYIFALDGF